MKHLVIVLLALATGTLCRAAETQADFYVSTGGSDSWSGTLAAPNAQRSDGPFATLERARDAVRDLKKQQIDRHRCSDSRGNLSTEEHGRVRSGGFGRR